MKRPINKIEAISYLRSLEIEDSLITEEKILLAQFLSTNPSVDQIYLCTSLILNEREKIKNCQS